MSRRDLATLGKVLGVGLVAAALVYAIAWVAAVAPIYLAYRAITGKRKARHGKLIAAGAGSVVTALGLRLLPRRDKPLHEDDVYLSGVEAGMRSARRSAGFEDGKSLESTRMLERPYP